MFNERLEIIWKLELILEFGIFIENIENENQNRNNTICFVLLNYNDKNSNMWSHNDFFFKLFKIPIEQTGMVDHIYIWKRPFIKFFLYKFYSNLSITLVRFKYAMKRFHFWSYIVRITWMYSKYLHILHALKFVF